MIKGMAAMSEERKAVTEFREEESEGRETIVR